MLLWPEFFRIFLARPANSFDSGELRLRGTPAFDRSNMGGLSGTTM